MEGHWCRIECGQTRGDEKIDALTGQFRQEVKKMKPKYDAHMRRKFINDPLSLSPSLYINSPCVYFPALTKDGPSIGDGVFVCNHK